MSWCHKYMAGALGWRRDSVFTWNLYEGRLWSRYGICWKLKIAFRFARELRTIYDNLRQLEQDPSDPLYSFLKLRSRSYPHTPPFATVGKFHDWFTFLYRRRMPDPHSVSVEPFRHDLSDNSAIKFTHGDLHRSNILVTRSRLYRVLAIVDWERSGWFPSYWEARKAQYTAERDEEWSKRYLPMILDQYASTWDPWGYYRGHGLLS
ncbi:hypothetical protein GX50_08993 [[Emmonsia] crescens]|uniref:Aminoglycoside phosphotransferase domain-containing protein n=1 Tax=[Emmonsia] crescens TaxID=73230 RepID=A0A2B7YFZ4_9EURO|nr:hypothetical protein GX50_08993 [Emmonsia crescens]